LGVPSAAFIHSIVSLRVYEPQAILHQRKPPFNMFDAWFNERRAPEGAPEDGCHPDEVQGLKDYFHKKTSAKEAAAAITGPIKGSQDPHDTLYRLWALLVEALIEWPAAQITTLIRLLDSIQDFPEPDLAG